MRGAVTTLKQCRTCKFEKPLEDFYPHKLGKMGRHPNCIKCYVALRKARQLENRVATEAAAHEGRIVDEKGQPVDLASLPKDAQANVLAFIAADKNRDKVLEQNHPAEMTPEFVKATAASAALFTMRVPPFLGRSCSCCRQGTGSTIMDRGAYAICARCAVSVDVCGRCVLHSGPVLRPELQNEPAPTQHDVLVSLGEFSPPRSEPFVPSPPPDDD